MNIIDVLIKYWGHTKFRLKQEEVIQQIINNKDTLALLPTGGGKSICYQVPALIKEGICLVISPLISLMNDQIRYLQSKNIKSVCITSDMHYLEIESALTNCIYGGIKFLYLSPEKLQNSLVQQRIKEMNINLITVDEAHCISEWGHNFRPSYRHISAIRELIPNSPILALTATATNDVIQDIQNNLAFKKENVIKASLKRENVSYMVEYIENKQAKMIELLEKIKSSTIIYVGTRRRAKDISNFLNKNNFSSSYYHAGLESDERVKRQKDWNTNQIRIMVATNSFGMGINKPDVKLVIHMDLPSRIEYYFQEAGRVGRNGDKAYAFLLTNKDDIIKQKHLLKLKYPTINEILKFYQNIANYTQIAVGELPKEPIPFDIMEFNKRYKTNTLTTYYILKYLEKEEEIKFLDNTHSISKLKINVSKTELYKFQITNKSYDAFIKILLRSHANLFNHYVKINEKQLALRLNNSTDYVKQTLNRLQKLEIIEYQEKDHLAQLRFLQHRKDIEKLHLNNNSWQERKNYDESKLTHIINYINKKDVCRSQLLLEYFGEKKSEKCNICDICINNKIKN